MRRVLLILILLTGASLWAQSISLSQSRWVNPTFPLTVTGSYSLASGDSLLAIEWKEKNASDWTQVAVVDTAHHTFQQTISSSPGEGIFEYLFRLTSRKNTTGVTASIKIILDLTPPFVSKWQAAPDYISFANALVTVSIKFSEPVSDSGSVMRLVSVDGQHSILLSPTLVGDDSLTVNIHRSLFSDGNVWKGKPALHIGGYRDTLNNVMDSLTLHPFAVDLLPPAAPQITGNYPAIVSEEVLSVSGKKEKKARLFVQDSLREEFTGQENWTVDLPVPQDTLYQFRFYQVDSLGNPGDTTVFMVLADHQPPQLLMTPILLLKYSSSGNQYAELTLNFSENVLLTSLSSIKLKGATGEQITLSGSPLGSPAAIQVLSIHSASALNTIRQWIEQQTAVTLSIEAQTVQDMAGNRNAEAIESPVLVQVQNLVAAFTPLDPYLNPDSRIHRDTLWARIILQPGNRDSLLLLLQVQNHLGEDVFRFSRAMNLQGQERVSLSPGFIQRVGGSGTSWDTLLWAFPVADLPEDKYTASVSVQSFLQGAASLFSSFHFWVDGTAPVLKAISPISGHTVHYISPQPTFVLHYRMHLKDSPIDSVKVEFDLARQGSQSPGRLVQPLEPVPEKPGVFAIDLKQRNITLVNGIRTLRFTSRDKSGNENQVSFTYNVNVSPGNEIADLYNYPNPFNPSGGEVTYISFITGIEGPVELYIYDLSFHLVYYRKYSMSELGMGSKRKTLIWNGRNLRGQITANGIYLARIVINEIRSQILKIMVNNK